MSNLKQKLYEELALKNLLANTGVGFDPKIFTQIGSSHAESVHCLFDYSVDEHVGVNIPPAFVLPHGLITLLKADNRSPYRLERDADRFIITKGGNEITEVTFIKRPKYYDLKTTDGTPMKNVAVYGSDGVIFIAYSNECSLKESGKDCLFCNINHTKATYGEVEGINWKYPKQIGETVAAAYKEGGRHLTISGGFVPERREVEYYLDVAESIKEHTGLEDFNGTACIGAPHDLSVISKYKEAGYRTLATNIEVWDRNFFKAYCPGKEELCGGYDHWIKSLKHSVKVFGRGRVRSNLVGGLESKQSTLEGLEYLADAGVIALAPAWNPNNGSALEGHRSPEAEWHLDLAYRNAAILQKHGYTYEQLYDAYANSQTLVHDIYRIENELLPVFNSNEVLEEAF